MKIHRELTIKCASTQLPALAAAIEKYLPNGWNRNRDAERKLHDFYLCFGCSSRTGLPDAEVWIAYSADRSVAWAANIIPTSSSRLDVDSYNRILEDLYENAVQTAANELGFPTSLSEADVGANHFGLSNRSIELLQLFSAAANKSTGSSHPADRQRWYDFLISVHRDSADLDVTTLGRLLTESYGWSDTIAADLRLEYEFAIGLLDRYDSTR